MGQSSGNYAILLLCIYRHLESYNLSQFYVNSLQVYSFIANITLRRVRIWNLAQIFPWCLKAIFQIPPLRSVTFFFTLNRKFLFTNNRCLLKFCLEMFIFFLVIELTGPHLKDFLCTPSCARHSFTHSLTPNLNCYWVFFANYLNGSLFASFCTICFANCHAVQIFL